LGLRPHHMLQGRLELRGELAMGDEHHSDHWDIDPSLLRAEPLFVCTANRMARAMRRKCP
jgi:hypothetical protein